VSPLPPVLEQNRTDAPVLARAGKPPQKYGELH